MNDHGFVVGDEVSLRKVKTAVNPYGGQPTESTTTLHGEVAATDREALHLTGDPDQPATRVPWNEIDAIELDGLNPHRLDPLTEPVLVRVYPGHRQSDAAEVYADEALDLASYGYLPVAHSWAVGEPGIGRVMASG